MSDIRPKLLAVFQIEHREHLERIRAILAKVESDGASSTIGELDEAFRRAHTLKGAARAVDLPEVETLAHQLETLFARVREGAARLDPPMMEVIHAALDLIEDSVSALLDESPVDGSSPPAKTTGPFPSVQPVDTVRIHTQHLDQLLRTAGQLLSEGQRQETVTQELAGLSEQLLELQREWELVRKHAGAGLPALNERPQLAGAARHLESVERHLNSLSSRARAVRRLQQQTSRTLRSLGDQLKSDVQRARMVPVETVFVGFRKMMRDLARDAEKEIRFVVAGFDVEADRMVLQALKDPVMHLLRNAVSHGVESPEERQQKGKNPIGEVKLLIEVVGNRLLIWVEDDGRGIDLKQVAQVAVQRQFLSASAAEKSSPEEITRLIFQPGFSTAPAVTELSGRGLGLSIVSEAASHLQGEVLIQQRDGPGSTIFITVPVTISTHRLLLVTCQGQTFGIPVHGIERIERVKIQDLDEVEGKQVLRLQGRLVPLLSLAHLLGIGDASVGVEGTALRVVILKSSEKRAAVVVDEFLSQIDGLIQDLDPCLARVAKAGSGVLLADGSIALVLNPTDLVEAFKSAKDQPSLKTAQLAPEKKRPSILIVDDSITTRTLEKNILEAHGYQVGVAVDGVEALTYLRSQAADLVISDIQMPRMDGFALLEEMKKDNRLAPIPVILVTSMESHTDQERGLALGAGAYIVKRKFDQRDLLETIQQML